MPNEQLLATPRFLRASRELAWVALGNLAAVLGSFAATRLLTEFLEPAVYGELALALTAVTLFNQTAMGPLGNGATRFYAPAAEHNQLREYLSVVKRLACRAALLLLTTTLLVMSAAVVFGYTHLSGLIVACFFFALGSGAISIVSGLQTAARQRMVVALHQGLDSWARCTLAVILVIYVGPKSTVAMVGYAAAALLVLVSQYRLFSKHHSLSIAEHSVGCSDWQSQILGYAWPMAITGIMSWGFFASQRWALQIFGSVQDVGYFAAVFQVGFAPLNLAGGILMSFLMPVIFVSAGDGKDLERVRKVSRSIIAVCVGGGVLVVAMVFLAASFHDFVFRMLVGEQYRSVSHFLPLVVLAAGLFQLSVGLATVVMAKGTTSRLIPLNTIGNGLVILLTFSGTAWSGMNGLFISMVVGSLVHLLWSAYNSYRVLTHD